MAFTINILMRARRIVLYCTLKGASSARIVLYVTFAREWYAPLSEHYIKVVESGV